MEENVYRKDLYNLCLLEGVISVSKTWRMALTKYVARISVLALKIEE